MRKSVAFLLLATSVTACSTPHRVPAEHIVMVNYRGNPVDPAFHPWLGVGPYREFEGTQFETHMGEVVEHLRYFAEHGREKPAPGMESAPAHQGHASAPNAGSARASTPDQGEKHRRVVIFIHGGLNTQLGSVKRAAELHDEMIEDHVYPLFVNWQSSLVSSYWDHLFVIRFSKENRWAAFLTAPFVITSDLLRAIGRAPMTIWNEAENALESTHFIKSKNQAIGEELADDALAHGMSVEFPENHQDPGSGALVLARDVVLMLPHMVLGILLDIGGTSSWDIMHRRTSLTMESEATYRGKTVAKPKLAAVPRLFDEVRKLQEELALQGIDLQVDVVAHSMGCIIANLLLENVRLLPLDAKLQPGCEKEALPVITNLVYMADADTAQKTERAVTSYLLGKGHEKTNFTMLSLNDRAEVAETAGWYLAPKSSLLVWIDQSYEPTPSMPDQRAGKMINQLFLLHRIPHGLRERVHVKSFTFDTKDSKTNPVEHGDFSEGKFWRPEYFTPKERATP